MDGDETNSIDKYTVCEILDLKAMLEMQEIINQEQEEKLEKCAEEKTNWMNEKLTYINKLSKLQEDFDKSTATIKTLKQKVNELKVELDVEKKEADDEREKVMWLTKDNENLLQSLEKQMLKIKKLKCQLEDERSFYAQEKARYCKEMKRKKNHSTEVQTDNSLEDDSVCSKNCSSNDGKEVLRLKSLYKHQLITTCLICEKYIKLQKYKTVLANRLAQTRKEYKAAMCDIMLEFDKCRNEYTTLLENKCMDCNTESTLKIVNRSNRLASDNAILKQELMHLNNRIQQLKKFGSEETTVENHSNSHANSRSTALQKRWQRQVRIKEVNGSDHNSENINSSTPESVDNEHSNLQPASNHSKRIRKRSYKRFVKRRRRRTYIGVSGVSHATGSENSDNSDKSFQNSNTTNLFSSFVSFNSENADSKNIPNCTLPEDIPTVRLGVDVEYKSKEVYENDEPAYIQVTCDEIKPYIKDGMIIQSPAKPQDDLKSELQAWLARTPVIECSEWSKSVQGIDIMKTESAPEILTFRSLSLWSLQQI